MSVIQTLLIDRLLNYLDESLVKGKVKFNGAYRDYNVLETVRDGNIIRKYVYMEDEEGLVEEAQLLSNNGDILAVKPFSIQKDDNGLVLAFVFTLIVQEG